MSEPSYEEMAIRAARTDLDAMWRLQTLSAMREMQNCQTPSSTGWKGSHSHE